MNTHVVGPWDKDRTPSGSSTPRTGRGVDTEGHISVRNTMSKKFLI